MEKLTRLSLREVLEIIDSILGKLGYKKLDEYCSEGDNINLSYVNKATNNLVKITIKREKSGLLKLRLIGLKENDEKKFQEYYMRSRGGG